MSTSGDIVLTAALLRPELCRPGGHEPKPVPPPHGLCRSSHGVCRCFRGCATALEQWGRQVEHPTTLNSRGTPIAIFPAGPSRAVIQLHNRFAHERVHLQPVFGVAILTLAERPGKVTPSDSQPDAISCICSIIPAVSDDPSPINRPGKAKWGSSRRSGLEPTRRGPHYRATHPAPDLLNA